MQGYFRLKVFSNKVLIIIVSINFQPNKNKRRKRCCVIKELVHTFEPEVVMHQLREEQSYYGHFNTVKDSIIVRVVNYEKNKEILKKCPYIKIHDLAITFRWIARQDDIGISTALITDEELGSWNIGIQELFCAGIANTKRIFPGEIFTMQSMLTHLMPGLEIGEAGIDLYVLTNQCKIHGATAILYQDMIAGFARELNMDLYILPSSVHELILVPAYEYIDVYQLYEMVKEVNDTVVALGDILSYNVYKYCKETDQIVIA